MLVPLAHASEGGQALLAPLAHASEGGQALLVPLAHASKGEQALLAPLAHATCSHRLHYPNSKIVCRNFFFPQGSWLFCLHI